MTRTFSPPTGVGLTALAIAALSASLWAQTGTSTVETVSVVSKKLAKNVPLPAELAAFQSIAVYPRVSGFIESMAVDRGSWVKRGDTLAVLSAPELQAQETEAEAKVQRVESQRAEAEAKLASLEAALAGTRSNIAGARAALAGAESAIVEAQSNVTGAQSKSKGDQATLAGGEATLAATDSTVAGSEATLAGGEAALTNLQTTYDRIKKAAKTSGAVAPTDLDAALRAVEVQRAVNTAQRATIAAQRSTVAAQRSTTAAQRASIETQGAVVESLEARVRTLRSGLDTQRANIEALEASLAAQEAGIRAQRSAVEALRNERLAATAAVDAVKTIYGYLRVTAPFAGVVTERNAHPGSLVGPSAGAANMPLVRLDDIAKLRLTVGVPEAYAGSISNGSRVAFTVPAYPGEPFNGVIQRSSHTLDPKTRTMTVEIDVDNPGSRLLPGMFATVDWPVARSSTTFFVPPAAIVNTNERTFVIAVRDGAAAWIDVRRGVQDGGLIEVFGALKPDDVLVKRGTDELRPGTKLASK